MEFLDNFVSQQEARRYAAACASYNAGPAHATAPHSASVTHRHSQLEVRLVPEKSCWVALPPAYVARLLESQSPIPLVLQLTSASGMLALRKIEGKCDSRPPDMIKRSGEQSCHSLSGRSWHAGSAGEARSWYVAWSGAASTSKALEVPAALATCQGLSDGLLVRVHALPGTPVASQVSVEPASVNDWEQVELNAEFMEEQLLNQASPLSSPFAAPAFCRNLGQ